MPDSAPTELQSDGAGRGLVVLFAATLCCSSALLFWVQPMFGKMVLPMLGGTPGVWNTAMVFFQAALLLGYAYAHLGARFFSARVSVGVHLALIVAAVIALPLAVGEPPRDISHPAFWMLGRMALTIGPPFVVVAASAPLFQRWLLLTGHPHGRDPYFLYAASNAGSMVGLLAYPLVVEPLLALPAQTGLWSGGYALLGLLAAACGVAVLRARGPSTVERPTDPGAGEPVRWRTRLHWIALAFVPSSLLLGVTTHLTTDVAAAPLLWVVPLALYLLSFVFVFAKRPLLRHSWMLKSQALLLVLGLSFMPVAFRLFWPSVLVHLLLFFTTAMVCHGELVARRPAAAHLTDFYLTMSFGGVLGGAFNALLAPAVFPGIWEYGLVLAVALALRPREGSEARRYWVFALFALAPAVLLQIPRLVDLVAPAAVGAVAFFAAPAAALAVFASRRDPLRFAAATGVFLVTVAVSMGYDFLHRERSFFGVHRIWKTSHGYYMLLHGTTLHGVQSADPERWGEPLGYFSQSGPLGQVFDRVDPDVRVGTVGLGAGTSLCLAPKTADWTFFEIDPVVEKIADDTRYFHYTEVCRTARYRVVLGDARVSLVDEPDGSFDLFVLDAFSSDAIPTHLLTREAVALYRRKLAPGGAVMVHTSNKHLDVSGLLGTLFEDAGMTARRQFHHATDEQQAQEVYGSDWVIAADDPATIRRYTDDRWVPLKPRPGLRPWTDDYSNILALIK